MLCSATHIWWIEEREHGIGIYRVCNVVNFDVCVCSFVCVLNTSAGVLYMHANVRRCVCVCVLLSVYLFSLRMFTCVGVSVCFLCLVVTHFFDNAHFALKHVLVDFLLSKIISVGSVAFGSIQWSCVCYSYLFWQHWPLNSVVAILYDCSVFFPYIAAFAQNYCQQHQF